MRREPGLREKISVLLLVERDYFASFFSIPLLNQTALALLLLRNILEKDVMFHVVIQRKVDTEGIEMDRFSASRNSDCNPYHSCLIVVAITRDIMQS